MSAFRAMCLAVCLLMCTGRARAGTAMADLQALTSYPCAGNVGPNQVCSPGNIFAVQWVISNNGPGDVVDATFSESTIGSNGSAPLQCDWHCIEYSQSGTCTQGSGAGNTILDPHLSLPAGQQVTYVQECYVPPNFGIGSLTYSQSLVVPDGVTDPDLANNNTTASSNLFPYAPYIDLNIDDRVSTVAPGDTATYSIALSNPVGADVPAQVSVIFPPDEKCTWTCQPVPGAACTSAGTGNINDLIQLPRGTESSVTYTAACTVALGASGTVTVYATVGGPDIHGGDSFNASDTDNVLPLSDLAIAVAHGGNTIPGLPLTYTITASNAGPADATDSLVQNSFPTSLACNWTCTGTAGATCSATGSGNIADTASLPAGTSATYQGSCAIPSSATGTLIDSVSILPGNTSADIARADNTAQDTAVLTPQSDVAVILFDDTRSYVQLNDVLAYTMLVSNETGPSDAKVSVLDGLPQGLSNGSWVCVASPGVGCSAGTGQTLSTTVNLPAGAFVEYIYSARVSGAELNDQIVNSVTVQTLNSVDPVSSNNTASDTDTLVIFRSGFESALDSVRP